MWGKVKLGKGLENTFEVLEETVAVIRQKHIIRKFCFSLKCPRTIQSHNEDKRDPIEKSVSEQRVSKYKNKIDGRVKEKQMGDEELEN